MVMRASPARRSAAGPLAGVLRDLERRTRAVESHRPTAGPGVGDGPVGAVW
ncbi:hypothetical protein GCM10009716_10100 [Streptomyces sodiiphilus]|uniref:Uncharacterized protein n=1 Tax=Streptomyces sodiiphilus TaxID=226217 RepID=A0ABP5A3G2_9ACTN